MLRIFSVAPFVIAAALGPFSVVASELLEIEGFAVTVDCNSRGAVRFEYRAGKYLRADRDGTTHNNLDDLPDC